MEYIDLVINGKNFIIINFPKEFEVEQFDNTILYKKQGKDSFKQLTAHKSGNLKLISRVDELDRKTIFNRISHYNSDKISVKRFIDSFLNISKITIDESLLEIEEFKSYKFLNNPYIFKLILFTEMT
jgi:hypothetical protein